ncbi:hypothetical protein ILUMI_17721 [Ignelater luminosus]|uniref:Uncharacterized protein n=1 Tax=Ignelater luminosus TaxID=2038154 RepID=A0A8K0CNI2_IGNLU|nr:hypothetical protein ILUMI_17721 [Ignelater luminosus]
MTLKVRTFLSKQRMIRFRERYEARFERPGRHGYQRNKSERTNIGIEEDYPKEVIEDRKAMIPQLKRPDKEDVRPTLNTTN